MKPMPDHAGLPSGRAHEFDFVVGLSATPDKVWTDAFTKFERERIGYEQRAIARFHDDRMVVLTTLKGLPERWSHLQQAAQSANRAASQAKQQEIEDAKRAEQEEAAFRAALQAAVNQLPR